MLVLFTDSDTDFDLQKCKEYGYKLISMPYIVDGKEIYPYVDFEEFDYKSFYGMLRKGVLPKTTALSPVDYVKYFEPEFAKGNDIFYVHFSAAMTGTFNSMHIALEELKEKYPERKFYEIDTKGITLGSLNIVYEVGDMFKAGKTPEEVLEWAKTEVDKFAVYFYADNLKFFGRSGRVSGFKAFMGNLFGIHPIITMNSEGKMVPVGSIRGKKKALKRLFDIVVDLAEDIKDHRIIIGHCDCEDLAHTLGDMVKAHYGEDTEIMYQVVNPTAGSHCGPDTLGIVFHAKHR